MRMPWFGGLAVVFVLLATAASGQWTNPTTPGIARTPDGRPDLTAPVPRTADGRPDLSGIWASPRGFVGTSGFTADLIRDFNVAGAVMTPWAEGVQAQRQKRNHVDDPLGYCLPPAPPRLDAAARFKIISTPTVTAILYEVISGSTFRQVFSDGRKLPRGDIEPTFLGYSVGRWEADTFVVETNGFRDLGWLDINGHPHSDALFLTERFRRITVGQMELTVTIADPKAYIKPWQFTVPLRLVADLELLESYCENHAKTMEHRRIDPAPPEPPSPRLP